jgi:KDO2-lipid IV(A) lauroyltransferase
MGVGLLPWLSRSAVVRLSKAMGAIAYRISKRPRSVALANLELAYGERLNSDERERIARQSFCTFALVVLDLFWFARRTKERILKYVEFDPSCDAAFSLKPAVCITGHIGNWEIIGHSVAIKDPPFLSIAAPLQNAAVDRMLYRFRRGSPQEVAYKAGAMREAIKALRSGGRIGMLLDQNILPREGGEFVEFFGLPVPISSLAGKLAMRTGVPITMMFCIPQDGGRYICHSPDPMLIEEGADPTEITRRIAGMLEEEIREGPGHWLWMYKRWRVIPPDCEDDSKYPFYADRVSGNVD